MEKEIVKLNVYYYTTETLFVSRGPITISEETHPELKGMTEDEMMEYIKENAGDMGSTSEYYENLEEELMDADIIKEKYIPENVEIEVQVKKTNSEDEE